MVNVSLLRFQDDKYIDYVVEIDVCYYKRTFADREVKMPSTVAFFLSAGEGRARAKENL